MFRIRILFICLCHSIFPTIYAFDCNNEISEWRATIYDEAINAVQPYLNGESSFIVYSIQNYQRKYYDNETDGYPFSIIVILSSKGDCTYIGWNLGYYNENLVNPERIIRKIDLNEKISYYKFKDFFFYKDGSSFFNDMFDKDQYVDCYITGPEYSSNPGITSSTSCFYAMIDEDGNVHGATCTPLFELSPIPAHYTGAMFGLLMQTYNKLIRERLRVP